MTETVIAAGSDSSRVRARVIHSLCEDIMSSASIKRIGIMTGGGDCPGLNAVIRSVVKTAIREFKLEVIGIADGYLGLIENRMHRLGFTDVSNILDKGGTILGTSNKADPGRYAVGQDEQGNTIWEDVTERVQKHVYENELDAVVAIGGDGTMSGASNLIRHGVRMVGVPKTIDNDLMYTEMTFGFQTAVQTATEALDRIRTTASSHHRVMVVELMGRNAGWLTLHAGIASGADIILIPELPYSLEQICELCVDRSCCGKAYTIIAVSEGAKPVGGDVVVDRVVKESPDPVRLGGISEVLCEHISNSTGLESRAVILGHVQRGGTPVAFDRVLGTHYGHEALDMLMRGEINRMVALQDGKMTSVPIEDVADKQRLVPVDHPLVIATRGTGASFCEGAES